MTAATSFEPLDVEGRERVWRSSIEAAGAGAELLAFDGLASIGSVGGGGRGVCPRVAGQVRRGDVDVSGLARRYALDGRAIQNALKLALALSAAEASNEQCAAARLSEAEQVAPVLRQVFIEEAVQMTSQFTRDFTSDLGRDPFFNGP